MASFHENGSPDRLYHRKAIGDSDDAWQRRRALHLDVFEGCIFPLGVPEPSGEQTHFAFKCAIDPSGLSWMAGLWPIVKVVYLCRSGVEVVNSMSEWPGFQHMTFAQLCCAWRDSTMRVLRRTDHPQVRSAVFRHEDFHSADRLAEILTQLGLDVDHEPADFLVGNRINQEVDIPGRARPVGSSDSILQQWESERCEVFSEICGPLMTELGYEFRVPGTT